MQGKSAKRPANVGAPNQLRLHVVLYTVVYMFTLACSNECLLSVAYITASSSIYIDGVVAVRPARPIMLLLPSLLQLITELQ